MSDIYKAKGGAVVFIGGRRVVVHEGATARAGHPIMKGREAMFEPLHIDFDLDDASTPAPAAPASGGTASQPSAKDVRAWAAGHGVDVPARGKIPDEVYEQYKASQGA